MTTPLVLFARDLKIQERFRDEYLIEYIWIPKHLSLVLFAGDLKKFVLMIEEMFPDKYLVMVLNR